jgi:glycerophosphoryl diester phosphodiesterase
METNNKMKHYSTYFVLLWLAIFTQCSQKEQIQVIAHRGGANLAPENTLAAFKNAIQLGVDMIEIDIEQTSDSVVVVIHDRTINRTTTGSGAVDSLTYDEIRALDAGSWFDSRYKDERIPTLDEAMELIAGKVVLLIEIKSGGERYPGIEQRTIESIQKYNAKSWVIVQSFNLKAVERIEAMDPEVKTYYLLGRNFTEYFDMHFTEEKQPEDKAFSFDGLAVHHSQLTDENIPIMQNYGLDVFTWTVDEPEEMQRLIDAGVDGIITDAPDVLLQVVSK